MRIMAMTTRTEMVLATTMLAALRDTPSYVAAARVFAESFKSEGGWAAPVVARSWRDDDFALMQRVLTQWFGPSA